MTEQSGQSEVRPTHSTGLAIAVAAVAIVAAGTAVWLFPRALPIVALDQRITRESALATADSFFRTHDIAPAEARRAVRFQGHDSLRTYVELAGGGHDSLAALVRGRDVAPFTWSVRAFRPSDPHEARVDLAPDGRILGFERKLAEADRRPALSADSAQRLAASVLGDWIGEPLSRWRVVASSYDTKKSSARIDRTFTFERTDRRVASAPIRLEVVIAGDTPARARRYVEIPESFQRRYAEMRSANELFALIASLGALAIAIFGSVALYTYARARAVRWREPFVVGGVIGGLAFLAALNELPGSWYGYDTAMSPVTFQVMLAAGALATGALTVLLVAFTLAAAEVATRHAFPEHLDWWKLWRFLGTREVAGRVAGGYATAAIAFAYVGLFYLVTRTLFGWWVPSELLDDPNQIASPMPWVSGIAVSLNAGVWEEALFRALPLSLLALWVGRRPRRTWWMAGGVVLSALVFGFAHASYASWPPYSRGVEIFLDACFWAALFLVFGLLVTVVAHFAYDLVLFGLFAASGSAPAYRVTAAIILAALLAPAIAVAWRWARQRGLSTAPPEARFAAWTLEPEQAPPVEPMRPADRVLTARARRLALGAAVLGVLAALVMPSTPVLGPEFTASRARVLNVADSVLRARRGDPAQWTRLSTTATDTLDAWPRFLREHHLASQAQGYARSYIPAAWWVVRYVRTDAGTAAERAEEWRVRLWPDGRPLDVRHIIPETARRDTVTVPQARHIALTALAGAGVDTSKLREVEVKETARPARRDVTVTYTDTSVRLPAGAATRAWVQLAGSEPLVARRGMELPESFLRADRERQSTRSLIAGISAVLLIVGIIVGAILVIRRRPPLLNDGLLDRRAKIGLVVALAVIALIKQANALPATLFGYDTSEPWSRFLGTIALATAAVVPVSLFALGMWLALTALRRRVGIPMLHGTPSRTTRNEVLLGGLGLGALIHVAAELRALVPMNSVPHVPSTLLNAALPFLSDATDLPSQVLLAVAVVGIPLLVVAGLTTRWAIRLLIAAAMAVLFVVAVVALSPATDVSATGVALLVIQLALVVAAIRAWGTLSAWSWVVAALAHQALGGLHAIVHAPTLQERAAGATTLLLASGLIALIARHPRSATGPAPGDRRLATLEVSRPG
jgi:membrane protease YdiL (CAAX protease family)